MRGDGLNAHMNRILRLFRAYEAGTTNTAIRAALRKAGFESESRNMTTDLGRNEPQIRASPDFREICLFDYQESPLWARSQMQEWGWIHEYMFCTKG
jgi:hypothetical protein